MSFTELTCRSGGSNLNAGSLDGAAEAATAPLKTYTNGGWNSGTGVYTPAAGNPITDGVAVGQFVSVYTDGAGAPTGFVARVTVVGATTFTLSTSAKMGTAPTTAGAGITAVVGGAWLGPTGTSAFPLTTLTSALTNAAGNLPRVNLNNNQTYSVTGAAGSVAGAVNFYVEGYAAAFGDGGFATIDGGATGTIYQWLSFGATGTVWRYIVFQNNGNSGSNTAFIGGGGALFYRCWFKNFRASFWETGSALGVGGIFIECEGSGCNQSNSNPNAQGAGPIAANSSGGNTVVRCYLHDNNAGSNCFGVTGGGGCVVRDSIFSNNVRGVSVGGSVTIIERNTFYGQSSHGLVASGSNAAYVRDNIFVNNGGNGISGVNGFFQNNAFFNNTLGPYSSATTGFRDGTVTLTGDPFVNAAGGDFRLNATAGAGAACRAAGVGTFLVNGVVTTVSLPDAGAAQHADPTQPVVGSVRFGTVYNDGASTGTHTDPATTDVRLAVQWGAGGTEFTGTFTAAADYPAVGNVAAGVGYNFGALVGTRTDANPAHVLAGDTYGNPAAPLTGTLVVPTTPAPASASPASDWRVWDNREAVSYTVTIRAGDLTYPAVANCKRRQLQRRELEASNGAYVAGDRNWLVPVEMLPANVAPKVSDRITDAQGVVWSVLEAQLNTWQSWWRLTCRNLVLVADLRELVTLLAPSATQDAAGGRVPTYTAAVSNLPAKVLEVEAAADDRLGKRQAVKRYTAWVGQRVFPAANWRLKDSAGQVYTVLGWRAADRFDVLQALDLEVVK